MKAALLGAASTSEPNNGTIKGAQALDRALMLLADLVTADGAWPLAEIAHRHGLALSTAHRMISCLEANQFVVRTEPGRYRGGLGLSRLIPYIDPRTTIAAVARPLLRRLARKTGRVAHLGILEDEMVTYLVKEAPFRVEIFTKEGMQLEAYCSAIGKILLSKLPAEKLETYLTSGSFVALTAHTLVDPRLLKTEIRRAGQIGMAIDDREVADDLFCIAVPVDLTVLGIDVAISLSAPYESGDIDIAATDELKHVALALRGRLAGLKQPVE